MYCEQCGKRIYQGDTYYEIDGKPVCIDCVVEYLEENCMRSDEEGEFYEVDDMAYETDELNQLLKACEKKLEYDDEEIGDPSEEPEYWKER